MILLDSSILIELFRKNDKEKTLFYSLAKTNNILCISTITYYEIGIGNRKSHVDYWEKLTENLRILPFDRECSENAIAIYLDLLKSNKMIDLADILIGATALSHNIPIATLNDKHFNRIKGLEIIK
ncbi:MAG: type II toxin-antitoxin system VapC family toxin [Prolixibacteraceae bacterium]|jgi:tRNA(fMet)-specific endonuclease VapC|nr:type II toxin-antitoxin system VapC family toxin [Prolixibacteraceae bacterium]